MRAVVQPPRGGAGEPGGRFGFHSAGGACRVTLETSWPCTVGASHACAAGRAIVATGERYAF